MKVSISKVLAATFLWLALSVAAHAASSLYFSAAQNTGTQNPQTIGSVSIDNPTYASTAWTTSAPASSIDMIYYVNDTALFQATVDTNVSKGTHYIGSFWFGADCYVIIY